MLCNVPTKTNTDQSTYITRIEYIPIGKPFKPKLSCGCQKYLEVVVSMFYKYITP